MNTIEYQVGPPLPADGRASSPSDHWWSPPPHGRQSGEQLLPQACARSGGGGELLLP
jgi:hypothetical protein